ncbi:hypothetical protein F5887DRAFT_1278460 [Amanita rubescens]|nr:hypothetical protein F5887DRAFT_1278460 [Amanita rubescens]
MTTDLDRDTTASGATSRGSPMRRRNPVACLPCRKRKIRCNAGEGEVCDKCRPSGKPCVVLSVLCEDVIRARNYEPENMSIDELHNLIRRLVQQGHLSHADAPQTFNYQTSTPTPTDVNHTSFLPTPPFPPGTAQPYNIIHSNPTSLHQGYPIPHTNTSPHAPNPYFIPGHGNPTAMENHPRAPVPSASPFSTPASFTNPLTPHVSYVAHPGQGSFAFVNQDQAGQANHLPLGYGFDVQQMGYP